MHRDDVLLQVRLLAEPQRAVVALEGLDLQVHDVDVLGEEALGVAAV